MKIGILTHPQGANYGGILQCYALCTYLRKMGHEPIVIQRVANRSFFLWEWIRSILKTLHFPRYYSPNKSDRTANIRPFIQKYLVRTGPIDSKRKMKSLCGKSGFGAVIVGSDQVWRKSYAMNFGYNYFLDFVPDNVLKISYAASFGLSDWQYTEEETQSIRKLLARFKGISVRENEGITLLKDNIGIDATQLIDPTMLLTQEDYSRITSPRLISEKYLFVYWLGDKQIVLPEIGKWMTDGYTIVELYLREDKEQISVEDWLSYIMYADYVITDSFHGSVFSIIFNRQFKVAENKSGGNGRIVSLCNMLDISFEGAKKYNLVNGKIQHLQEIANHYLTSILR